MYSSVLVESLASSIYAIMSSAAKECNYQEASFNVATVASASAVRIPWYLGLSDQTTAA